MLRLTFLEFCARYLRGNGFLKLVAPTHGTRVCEYELAVNRETKKETSTTCQPATLSAVSSR